MTIHTQKQIKIDTLCKENKKQKKRKQFPFRNNFMLLWVRFFSSSWTVLCSILHVVLPGIISLSLLHQSRTKYTFFSWWYSGYKRNGTSTRKLSRQGVNLLILSIWWHAKRLEICEDERKSAYEKHRTNIINIFIRNKVVFRRKEVDDVLCISSWWAVISHSNLV